MIICQNLWWTSYLHRSKTFIKIQTMKNDLENGTSELTANLYPKECEIMKKRKKSLWRELRPYLILILCVVAIWVFGFTIGRCTASTSPVETTKVQAQELAILTETVYQEPVVEWLDFKATAYCSCSKCCNGWANNRPVDKYGNEIVLTASGDRAIEGVTIAADWSVLPKGTEVEIQDYGTYLVQDKGGSIKGNRIDIYFSNHQSALQFGVQNVKLRVVK